MIRTISMLPAATEIVGALGLMDQLLAVSHECDYPSEATTKPRITFCEIHEKGLSSAEIDRWTSERLRSGESLYEIDEALLRELAPDLILTQQLCNVCAPDYDSIAAMAQSLPSRPRVLNLEPSSLDDVLGNVREVAVAMGHPERAVNVCLELERRIADVSARAEGLAAPTVFVMEWADPIFNAGHWTPGLVQLAGGCPVLSVAGKDSIRVPWEELRAIDPEILVIACCGQSVERSAQDVPILESRTGWQQLRAVRTGQVYLVNGSAYFSRPGPRLVNTLEILASILHPEVFAGTHCPGAKDTQGLRWKA